MNYQEIANEICEAGREEIEVFSRQLYKAGLIWTGPDLVVLENKPKKFSVEFKVEFLEGINLLDIFEFFIFRDGILVVTEEEIRQWIRANVPLVLSRQGLKR